MAEIMLRGYKCERCTHQWYPRNKSNPKVCPKCKSPYWDRPKQKHGLSKNEKHRYR